MRILVIMLSLAVTLTAQVDYRIGDLQPTEKAIKETLLSNNDGAQNSGLYVLAQLKSVSPNKDFENFNALLKNIAMLDESPAVRQNANLTFAFLNSPTLVEKVKVDEKINPNKFFSLLNRELKQNFLVYSE